jgi:hypothetical protein
MCDLVPIYFEIGADELKRVKVNVKTSIFLCYICLCGATLMACESWKLCLLNNMDIEKSK